MALPLCKVIGPGKLPKAAAAGEKIVPDRR
jgi:hypothetical protein